jgi:hypothetical protein
MGVTDNVQVFYAVPNDFARHGNRVPVDGKTTDSDLTAICYESFDCLVECHQLVLNLGIRAHLMLLLAGTNTLPG